jgi:hypothetical protein
MVGEIKKARYVYCHCTGYKGKCLEPYTREESPKWPEIIFASPVWTRFELAKGVHGKFRVPRDTAGIGRRRATLQGLSKSHQAPRGPKGSSGPRSGDENSWRREVVKTLLPSTGFSRDHCNRRCPIAHNLSLLRPKSTGFILRIRPAINAS